MLSLRAPRRGSRSSPRGGGGGRCRPCCGACVCAARRTPPPNTHYLIISRSHKKKTAASPLPLARPRRARATLTKEVWCAKNNLHHSTYDSHTRHSCPTPTPLPALQLASSRLGHRELPAPLFPAPRQDVLTRLVRVPPAPHTGRRGVVWCAPGRGMGKLVGLSSRADESAAAHFIKPSLRLRLRKLGWYVRQPFLPTA